jgi:hypothetical protein
MDCLVDGKREADNSNPKGYYEYEPVMSIHKDNSWMDKAQNKTVKIVAPLLNKIDEQYRYKIIFMTRDLNEVLKSQQKMIGKTEDVFPVKLYNKFQKLLSNIEVWKKKEPGVELIYLDYKDVLDNPEFTVKSIERFLGVPLNRSEMINCIDKKLYRTKV